MSDDGEGWIYFDGPEPESVRVLFDVLRAPPALPPEEQARLTQSIMKQIDEAHALRSEAPSSRRHAARRSPRSESESASDPETKRAPEVRAQRSALPFQSAPPGQIAPPAPKPNVEKTMQVPVMRPPGAETFPIGDNSIQEALAVLPFVGNTAGTGMVMVPGLTIEQYASFRVELAVWPDRVTSIYREYRVTSRAAHAALDQAWEKLFEQRPDVRAQFEQALAIYEAWVRSAPFYPRGRRPR